MTDKQLPQAIKEAPFLAASMTAADVKAHVAMVQDIMRSVMVKGEDYGIIPGCEKPSLWKPGAEKLCVAFRLAPNFDSVETYDGNHLTVRSKCTLTHINSGKVIAQANAICSTKEKKYAKRKVNGKVVDNMELPDSYNTVLKMGDKRSLVACVLIGTAASSIFTQDMEDVAEPLVVVDAEATVKKEPKPEPKPEVAITESKVWVGRITAADPKESGRDKFIHIKGEDGTDLLLVQPSEKDKAAMDIYKAMFADLCVAVKEKEELEFVYGISPKGNKLVQGCKPVQVPF